MRNGGSGSRTSDLDQGEQLAGWLERRFPQRGRPQERTGRQLPRRLLAAALVLAALLAAAFVGAPFLPAYDGGGNRAKALSVVLAVLGFVSATVFFVAAMRHAMRAAEKQMKKPGDRPVLPALTSAERRELLAELRGRRPVVPGDEAALEALLRSRQQASTWGWLGVGQLCGAASALLRGQDRILSTVFTVSGVIALALIALAVRARLDVRAGRRLPARVSS